MRTFKIELVSALLLLSHSGIAIAEDDRPSPDPPNSFKMAHGAHEDAKNYVDAAAAGYDIHVANEEIQTNHFQLLAQKRPIAQVSRIANAKQWEAFLKEFAGSEVGTGEKLRYVPDFRKELVLALFAGPELRGDDYMGVEVYAEKAQLKGFVFHGLSLQRKDPVAICKASGQPFHGTFYLATVPKRFERNAIEFRMGYQSWGRACSRFSPVIANTPRHKRAEKPLLNK